MFACSSLRGALLLGSRQFQRRLEVARAVAERAAVVVVVREEREQPEVVLLREGIVLVVVALRAGERAAQPDGRRRVRAIDEDLVARLLGIDAALLVGHRVAMEPGGDLLLDRRVRQHVAGNLLDRELIERQVAVEGADHPVAVLPDIAAVVLLVAVGVGVAGEVEPRPRPALAVVRRREQPIDRPSRRRRDSCRRRRHRLLRASAAGRSGRSSPGAAASVFAASGDGASCSRSSRASTNASIGLRAQSFRATSGVAGRLGLT